MGSGQSREGRASAEGANKNWLTRVLLDHTENSRGDNLCGLLIYKRGTEDDNSRISSGKGNIPTLFDDPKDKILIDGEDGKIDSPREIIDRCVAGELFNCVMLWVHRLDDPVVATT